MLSIRRATTDDAEALSVVGSATMLETYADKIPGRDIVAHCIRRHSPAVYAAWLADPDIAIWVAETASHAAAGYLVLMPAALPEPEPYPDDLEVQRIYLLSRFHGTSTGHALMNQAIAETKARGKRQLVLGVLKTNTRAVDFYRRQGFAEIGTRTFKVGASVFDDFVMGKMIGS